MPRNLFHKLDPFSVLNTLLGSRQKVVSFDKIGPTVLNFVPFSYLVGVQ